MTWLGFEPVEKAKNKDDARFRNEHTAKRVMATSTGQNDSGLFELNFWDKR